MNAGQLKKHTIRFRLVNAATMLRTCENSRRLAAILANWPRELMAKSYSQRSPGAQRRIDRVITRSQGNRPHMLQLLREGKWSPFARSPERRLPKDVTSHPERYPGISRPRIQGGNKGALRDAALESMLGPQGLKEYLRVADYERFLRFNDLAVTARIGDMTDEELSFTANAGPEDLLAAAQTKGNNPWHYH